MSMEWYDMIARRNGGYKSNAKYTVEGESELHQVILIIHWKKIEMHLKKF